MNKGFYTKLALDNIKRNSKTYIPYILTCIMTVMMFYIMKSLSLNPGVQYMIGDNTLSIILNMGSFVVGFFSFIFLFYTNSFLMKRRKKEFGIFNILGMEKKHLAKVIFLESLFVAVISLVLGILFGIALDKVMFLSIAKMIEAEISLGFFISGKVIRFTIVLFGILFFLIFLKSINMLRVSNPVELLRGGNVGEREPKTKWIMTFLGILALGTGYYLALTTKNPISSLYIFFNAVLLVIVATYFLFVGGSIAFLKLLRKNKKYYYKTKHFISVSGMIYRMKQNAVGLANICILSTMVLVMVSATTSLIVGFEDILKTRYPNDFSVYSNEAGNRQNLEMVESIKKLQKEMNLSVENETEYYYVGISGVRHEDEFLTDPGEVNMISALDNINVLIFLTLDDYNSIMGENKTLGQEEILIYSNRDAYGSNTLRIFDRKYQVVEVLDDMCDNGVAVSNIASSHYIVLPDMEELEHINLCVVEADNTLQLGDSAIRYYYGFDTSADSKAQVAFQGNLRSVLSGLGYDVSSDCRAEDKDIMLGMYGGLFFLGIFLGVLFIMATVLIIYYKQVSEGYEDRERFAIMQKVGLSLKEVKSAIRSQVLTVFFLPLIVAGIHLAVAFPMISKLLNMLNMTNNNLYIGCVGCSFLVFAAIYIIIYGLTAKTYYKIVAGK